MKNFVGTDRRTEFSYERDGHKFIYNVSMDYENRWFYYVTVYDVTNSDMIGFVGKAKTNSIAHALDYLINEYEKGVI